VKQASYVLGLGLIFGGMAAAPGCTSSDKTSGGAPGGEGGVAPTSTTDSTGGDGTDDTGGSGGGETGGGAGEGTGGEEPAPGGAGGEASGAGGTGGQAPTAGAAGVATGGAVTAGAAGAAGAAGGVVAGAGGEPAGAGAAGEPSVAGAGGEPAVAGAGGAAGQPAMFWPGGYDPSGLPTPIDGNHNAGNDCMTCHVTGSDASSRVYLFAGTVYEADQSTGASNVQVGVSDGTNQYFAYSATNGNFWVLGDPATIDWANAEVKIRNASGELTMPGNYTPLQNCNGCHADSDALIEP
jgi:hypothetical protein